MDRMFRSRAFPYAIALTVTGLAVLLRALLDPWLEDRATFATMYAAIAASVWVGGYRPALLSCLLGYAACFYLFLLLEDSPFWYAPGGIAASIIYFLSSGVVILLGESIHLGKRRKAIIEESRRLNRELKRRVDEMETLMDLLPVAVLLAHDPECKQITGNRAARILYEASESGNLSKTADPTEAPKNFHVTRNGVELTLDELPMQKAARTGAEQRDVELEIRFDHGARRLITGDVSPLFDRRGRVRGAVAVYADVTERRLADAAMRESEQRLRTLSDNLPNGAIYQAEGGASGNVRFTFMSAGVESILGVRAEEVMRDPGVMYRLIHPDEVPRVMAAEAEAIRTATPFDCEFRSYTTKGDIVWIHCRSAPRKETDGRIWDGVILDVTARRQAEDARREAESRLNAIVDHSPAVIFLKDRDGRYLLVNRRFEEMAREWGAPGPYLGRTDFELLPADVAKTFRDDDLDVIQTRRMKVFEEEAVLGGERRAGLTTKFPLLNAQGEVYAVCGINIDITDRKRAETALRESETKYRRIVETANEGIWVLDEDARIVFANRRMADMLGYDLGDIIGRQKWDFVLPEQQQFVREMFERRRQGKRDQTDVGFRHHSGKPIWALLAAEPIFDDGIFRGSLDMLTDVTERRAAEQSLKEADRRKDEFLATLSHELRNPLAPIRNALELMRRADGNVEVQAKARELMERQLRQLVRLVDDLLDVSRITRNKLQLKRERVELNSAIQSAVEATRPMIDAAGHVLTVDLPKTPIYLDADPTRLAQVFANLLNNASKYTDRGGCIDLIARCQDGQLVASVKDTGIGLRAEDMPKLFDMFSQVVPALERSQGGLGIGLSLVKGLVEMHGGSIEARSDGPGKGSEFIVRLPVLEGTPCHDALPDKPEREKGKAARILVVDDNKDGAESLATVLRIMGHETHTAFDGQQAVDAAESFRPEVVLLDIGLPKLNGYQVAQRIREQDWGKSMTLFAITGWGQEDDKRKAKEAGFDRHLTKPVDPGMLEELLSRLG